MRGFPSAEQIVRADLAAAFKPDADRIDRAFILGPENFHCDAIYRPKRLSWLERALTWFTWNRSRA
jgi:hypothetical protein